MLSCSVISFRKRGQFPQRGNCGSRSRPRSSLNLKISGDHARSASERVSKRYHLALIEMDTLKLGVGSRGNSRIAHYRSGFQTAIQPFWSSRDCSAISPLRETSFATPLSGCRSYTCGSGFLPTILEQTVSTGEGMR